MATGSQDYRNGDYNLPDKEEEREGYNRDWDHAHGQSDYEKGDYKPYRLRVRPTITMQDGNTKEINDRT